MFSIKPLPEFTAWLDGLADATVRGVVVARIKRLERGLMGDVEPVGEGVSELRIHVGAGWRVYFTQHGTQLIVLLVGGSKRTQKSGMPTWAYSVRAWRFQAHAEERHKARQGSGGIVGLTGGNNHDQTY
jgi:putative addiction module killer protein